MVDLYLYPETAEPLTSTSRFRFHCHPGLSCFNACCRQPTIILKPYDILRLKKRLAITSTAFLTRYTLKITEGSSGLPLRLLALRGERGCPFLEPNAGCTVYEDRPAACRLFPVIQGSSLRGGKVQEAYFLKKLDFCGGFAPGPEWTLEHWQADQGLARFDELNHEWVSILLHVGARSAMAVNAQGVRLFELAVYDLDNFRRLVLETAFASTHAIPPNLADRMRRSDEALLRLGYAYARLVLHLTDARELQAVLHSLASLPADS